MSIEDTGVVDAIGSDDFDGEVVLLISDHLNWDDESNHLILLQSKINTYIRFYESGEIYEKYPSLSGRRVIIKIDFKYQVSDRFKWFIGQVKSVIKPIGLDIEYAVYD